MVKLVRSTTVLGRVQKGVPAITNSQPNVDVGTTPKVIYTCPAGKVATIRKLATRMISFGTGTIAAVRVNGFAVRENIIAPDTSLVDIPQASGATLDAGQTITLTSNGAGNNDSMNSLTVIEELPV